MQGLRFEPQILHFLLEIHEQEEDEEEHNDCT
jgi:hypothetical protein